MEELAKLEYEALRYEERDRMNARLQFWVIFLLLASAFSSFSVQSSNVAYAVALFPPLVMCLARYVNHSEGVLRQIRKYLYKTEKDTGYEGYEHFSRCQSRTGHGGYLDALRDALLMTQLLAVGVVVFRLMLDHMALVIVPIAGIEIGAMVLTWIWLRK